MGLSLQTNWLMYMVIESIVNVKQLINKALTYQEHCISSPCFHSPFIQASTLLLLGADLTSSHVSFTVSLCTSLLSFLSHLIFFFNLHTFILTDLSNTARNPRWVFKVCRARTLSLAFPNLHHLCGLGCLFWVTVLYRESISFTFFHWLKAF